MDHRFFFFAGGDYRSEGANAFTGNFIRYLSEIMGTRFSVIRGIYRSTPLANVIWALNRAQAPEKRPLHNQVLRSSLGQITSDPNISTSRVTLISSSYGSVVAAQAACCLAEKQINEGILSGAFNLALGASMVSKKSALYRKLLWYQEKGIIGTIIYDELQDEGDNSNGLGGETRLEAFANGIGICFPFLTFKYQGPSFLNTNPVSGHLHRVRAQSVQKALDFLQVILVDYELGGVEARVQASALLAP
jgi:hypothetical protein